MDGKKKENEIDGQRLSLHDFKGSHRYINSLRRKVKDSKIEFTRLRQKSTDVKR